MMWRWISLVPSHIRSTRASRQKRSMGRSSMRPMPPKICTALVGHPGKGLRRMELCLRDLAVGVEPLVEAPSCGEGQPVRRVDVRHHVRELEGDALEPPDGLPELPPARRVVHAEVEAAPRPADAHRGDGEAGCGEPGVRELEPGPFLAEDLRGRHPAVVEGEDAIVVAAVGDRAVAGADLEAGGAAVDEEAGDPLLRSRARLLLPGRDEGDDEVREVRVADEVLGAVDDEVAAVAPGMGLHPADVGARVGLGHREGVDLVAAHAGEEVALALLSASCAEDVGRPPPEHGERHRRPPELALEEGEGQVVEPPAPELRRDVGGVETEGADLVLDLPPELARDFAGALDLVLEGIELVLDEAPHRVHHELLFGVESEVHGSCSLALLVSSRLPRAAVPGHGAVPGKWGQSGFFVRAAGGGPAPRGAKNPL